MIEIIFNDTTLNLYSSIKEMPVKLHNLCQKFLLQDSGIGTNLSSIDEHFSTLDTLLASAKVDEARTERANLRYNMFMILEGLDFKSPAFACFIHSVNGSKVDDYSEEALNNLIESLSERGLTMQMVEDQLFELKKNFNLN